MIGRSVVKRALVDALLSKLTDELATMRRAAKDAREAATHEEAKPENDKDTRALEASYLAGAQAARVRDLEAAIKTIDGMPLLELEGKSIQSSAVVTLEDEDLVRTTFFVAPFGGGATLTVVELSAQVVTPPSPRGQALLGKSVGDVIEVRITDVRGAVKPGARELSIVDVW